MRDNSLLSQTPWTAAQLAGITTTGQGLLLSAAAGSGKTAVLATRCVYLVCEAPLACEIDEILVVAFNEAAATEMKGRIQAELQKAYLARPDHRLEKQVALAERAAISTLHSFCHRLLRQHFHRVGLDPNFTVLDADEAQLLRYDVVRELFTHRYETDETGRFQTLIDDYGDGDDERLVGQILKIYELLTSVIDPAAWRSEAVRRLEEAAKLPLNQSSLGKEFLGMIRADLDLLSDKIKAAEQLLKTMPQFRAYSDLLKEWQPTVAYWRSVLIEHGLDAFSSEAGSIDEIIAGKLPSMKSTLPNKDLAKATMDGIKKSMKEGFCRVGGKFTEKGWQQTVRRTAESAGLLMELVEAFQHAYADAKSMQRAVDFSDLERLSLAVLADRPADPASAPSDVARALHKRYKHVLVDEYQDINEVQDAILRLVSRESADHDPSNLFCVGDVKQSIYRFRLAEPQRFLDRAEIYRKGSSIRSNLKPGSVIDLQANFRSRGPLLDVLNDIFRAVMTKAAAEIDYDATHELHPKADYPPLQPGEFSGRPIELHVLPAGLARVDQSDEAADFEQDEYEASIVAERIWQMIGRRHTPAVKVFDRKAKVTRDARLGDIVVLLRARKFTADRYADVLRKWNIAAHADSGTGFFDSPEIRDMMALLLLLDNQKQDVPLVGVLRSPIGKLPTPEDDLATIRLAYPGERGNSIAFHEAARRYAAEQTDALAAHLRSFFNQMNRWRDLMHQRPVAEGIRAIYDEAGLLAYYSGLIDGDQRVANLEELYRRSAQFGTFARQGLSRFLRFLENLRDNSDAGQPSIDAEGADVVRIMTIHQSKGLEFPIVFLPSLGKKFNTRDACGEILADRRAYLALNTVDPDKLVRYPSLASVVLRDRIDAQLTAEEIRVLYVALTRAREHLVLIGSTRKSADAIKAQWAEHRGAMPAQHVRDAESPLDWLLPLAAMDAAQGRNWFSATWHDAAAVQALAGSPTASKRSDTIALLAALKPLAGAKPDATAERVVAQLRYQYPFETFAQLGAAKAVTAYAKGAPVDQPPHDYDADPAAGAAALDLPRFLAEDVQPRANDLGTFTHIVMQHLDFASSDVRQQIAGMVDRKLLTAAQADCVNADAIAWFLETDLGKLLRDNAKDVSRELPVYVPAEIEPSPDPADRVMLRGRLDAFINLPAGGVVIDYKTDRVTGTKLQERIALYRGQLQEYAKAMAAISGQTIAGVYLVFFHARNIVDVTNP